VQNSDNELRGQQLRRGLHGRGAVANTLPHAEEASVTHPELDDARRLAAEIGMDNLAPEVLEQLPAAAATAGKHRAALQAVVLTPADEPALVFSLQEARKP